MSTGAEQRIEVERPAAGRAAMRRAMFLSQDGVVLCTTVAALDELGILERSLDDELPVAELYPPLAERGWGALRVAVRSLASTGFVERGPTLDPATSFARWTDAGRLAARHRNRYVEAGRFLAGFGSAGDDAWSRPWDRGQVESFLELVEPAGKRWDLGDLAGELAELVTAHLDAALIVPAMLWLHETGRLGERGPSLPDDALGAGMARLLATLGWLDGADRGWTEAGEQARAFALSFGGVATYLPLLSRLPELYRGELTVGSGADGREWHVHRRLNLAISTKAHRRYFADADGVFLDIFDRPAEVRPRFIADMGCGDGAWLAHLHELLAGRLGEAPAMVGIDVSPTALERARARLDAAGVEAVLLRGDVTDPDRLAADLAEHGLGMEEGLHIRAFLDHERAYRGAGEELAAPGWSSGAYVDAEGRAVGAEALERDLIAHLARWARHTGRHGMVVLEAHCVAPRVASRNLGALHSVAFDAHQAYSHQYPIEHAAFLRCAQRAGMCPEGRHERRYPSDRPFVTIGLNRFVVPGTGEVLPAVDAGAPREDTWRPDPGADLEDGRALHAMLFEGGEVRSPRPWCCAPTGFVVAGALEAIEARLSGAEGGDVIRVLDYGAGTGTATIELLKACRERGLERRLGQADAALEVHLVDRPSSWYAQGYELLGRQAWTRFHSLSAPDGGFRPLPEVTGGRTMDVVMTNMVLHLIPPRALARAAEQLASVLVPGGRLLWSSPDLGPAGRWAVLLHDPNRALRRRWLELLHGTNGVSPSAVVRDAVEAARRELDPEALRAAQERAERRILPHPLASDVTAALDAHFQGEVEARGYEMLSEEIVDGLLVPSNQAEYLPEIDERPVREEVIRELMLQEVLPAMQDGSAGTALGLNLHWTLGTHARRT